MSAADEAWRLTADEMDLIVTEFTESRNPYDFIPAMARIKAAAYRRALEDAGDDYCCPECDNPAEWLRARAAAVAPRETKD